MQNSIISLPGLKSPLLRYKLAGVQHAFPLPAKKISLDMVKIREHRYSVTAVGLWSVTISQSLATCEVKSQICNLCHQILNYFAKFIFTHAD